MCQQKEAILISIQLRRRPPSNMKILKLAGDRQINRNNEEVRQYRQQRVRFIIQICEKLNISSATMGKAFFLVMAYEESSFKQFDQLACWIAGVYLASKLDDVPVDIDECLLHYSPQQKNKCGTRKESFNPIDQDEESFGKQILYEMETEILLSIGFNLNILVPQEFLAKYISKLSQYIDQTVFDSANALINDSYYLNICLTHRPDHIALACLFIALSLCNQTYLQIANKEWITNLIDTNDNSHTHQLQTLIAQITSLYQNSCINQQLISLQHEYSDKRIIQTNIDQIKANI